MNNCYCVFCDDPLPESVLAGIARPVTDETPSVELQVGPREIERCLEALRARVLLEVYRWL